MQGGTEENNILTDKGSYKKLRERNGVSGQTWCAELYWPNVIVVVVLFVLGRTSLRLMNVLVVIFEFLRFVIFLYGRAKLDWRFDG